MSLTAWKNEYYPETAHACVERVQKGRDTAIAFESPEAQKELLLHCLKKWSGCSEQEFDKHGLYVADGVELYDGGECPEELYLDSSSCSLCIAYLDFDKDGDGCTNCPLYKELGKRCDGDLSPYSRAMLGDYRPMQFWLNKALDTAKSKV